MWRFAVGKKSSNQSSSDFQGLSRAQTVVTNRSRKAFPELTLYFTWLSGGLTADAYWQGSMDDYARKLGQEPALRLLLEIHDLREISAAAKHVLALDTLIPVLGWDAARSTAGTPTAAELLDQLEDVIRSLWGVALA